MNISLEDLAGSIGPEGFVNPQVMQSGGFYNAGGGVNNQPAIVFPYRLTYSATGVALVDFRGESDAEYRRVFLTFPVPDSTGAAPFFFPQNFQVLTDVVSMAFPATVELDGSGVLGWGVDYANSGGDQDDQGRKFLRLYARLVVRSSNTVLIRVGYHVTFALNAQ